MKTGIELIAEERKRQIEVEKFDVVHDEGYSGMQLSGAAGCYIANAVSKSATCIEKEPNARFQVWEEGYWPREGKYIKSRWTDGWPWSKEWDKREKHDPIRSLVIAGALIAAELDRLHAES